MTFLSHCRFQSRWQRCLGGFARHQFNTPAVVGNAGSKSTHHHDVSARLVCHQSSMSVHANNFATQKLGHYQQWNDKIMITQQHHAQHDESSSQHPKQPHHSRKIIFGDDRRRWMSSTTSRVFLDMKTCETVEEASDMAFSKLDNLMPQNLSAFWSRIAQLMSPRHQRSGNNKSTKQQGSINKKDQQQQLMDQLQAVFSQTMDKINVFRPRDISETALGFAKIIKEVENNSRKHIRGTHHQILHDLLLIGDQKSRSSPQNKKEIVFQSIANATMMNLDDFNARCLSNLAYANAIVGYIPKFEEGGKLSNLFDHIAEKSIPRLRQFEPQEISNLVWSYEKVGESNPRLFEEVANAICALDDNISSPMRRSDQSSSLSPSRGLVNLGKFQPQHLSNVLLAFAKATTDGSSSHPLLFKKVEQSNPKLFEKVADHIIAHGYLSDFKAQELSNIVWAFATANIIHPRLFGTMAAHVASHIDMKALNRQGRINLLWAFEKAKDAEY
ncbi:hypothetical protein ACHAXR_007281 [Thalassiosira sp. AJA248-18]